MRQKTNINKNLYEILSFNQNTNKIHDFKLISADDLIITPKVRLKCIFGCTDFGTQRNCPPNDTLSPEKCRRYLNEYEKLILIRFYPKFYQSNKKIAQSILLKLEREAMLQNFRFAIAIFPTHCVQCDDCNLSQPCADPINSRASTSSLCIDVLGTLEKLGLGQKIVLERKNLESFYFIGMVLLE